MKAAVLTEKQFTELLAENAALVAERDAAREAKRDAETAYEELQIENDRLKAENMRMRVRLRISADSPPNPV